MSEIALYNLLKRIPHATDGEIEKAVSEVARSKDVATKLDILKIEKVIAESEARLIKQIYGAVAIILAGVGLMMKFL